MASGAARIMSTRTDRLDEFRCDAKVAAGLSQLANWPILNNVLVSTLNTMEVSDIGYSLQLTGDDSSDSSENSETFVPSTDSCETDCSSDENADFVMQEDLDTLEEEVLVNSALDKDMEQIKRLFGEDAITYRLFTYIDNIDVELNIYPGFLEKTVAEAWNMSRQEPLVVRINVSLSTYLDNPEVPKVEVFQPSKKDQPWGIGCQIKKIVETFVSNQWRKVGNRDVLRAHSMAPKSQSMPCDISDHCQQLKCSSDTDYLCHPLSKCSLNKKDNHQSSILERNSNCSNDESNNNSYQNPNSSSSSSSGSKSSSSSKANSKSNNINNNDSNESTPNDGASAISTGLSAFSPIKVGRFSLSRFLRLACSATVPNLSHSFTSDLSLVPSTTADAERSKRIPCLEYGFLSQVYLYTRQRIPTLNEYCVVCDQAHLFQNGSMLQPAVCARELCSFAFQDLGVMSTATTAMDTGAEVVDLLISMTKAACKSTRRDIIFNPYPTIIDPEKPTDFGLHPKHKDYKKVKSILKVFPTMSEMLWNSGKNLQKIMDERNRLAYPLLQWIITSNRSHIVKLPPTDQLTFMHTNHQFLLLSSAPAKEEIFRSAREKHGSTFAFHGSSIENWHSILRIGLLNASGTKYQVNGAAYGKGIYLSPISSISFRYSKMGHGFYTFHTASPNATAIPQHKNRFLQSDNINCIALCEVVKAPELEKHGNVWVCTKSEYVCTRFFFVYEDSQVGSAEINTQRSGVETQILKAVQCCMNAMRDK